METNGRAAARLIAGVMLASAAFVGAGGASAQLPSLSPDTAAIAPDQGVTARWTIGAARDLERVIEGAKAEGLRPADYSLSALKEAIDAGEGAGLDAVAESAALSLAHDYYFGRVGDRDGFQWHVERRGVDLATMLRQAIATDTIGRFYKGLLPDSPRYAALRDALADAADTASRDRIRANMERWRWMPRGMGDTMLYVNVPTYRLQVIDGGATTASYTVVVGAKDTPTPWLATEAPSLVVHPWWYVPDSIARKSGMKIGYRQPPGPRNALGQLKINLINDQAIYLHDTPAKWAFGKDERALSHGCVRVKDIGALAALLMEGDADRLDRAMARKDTATLALPKRWPVYIVYFTMDLDEQGDLVSYGDPYGRDAELIARLGGARPMQMASN